MEDAETLFNASRFDGARYICGYALELTFKARIVDVLRWSGFPETNAEFSGLGSFKTHDLEILLLLSAKDATFKATYLADWSTIVAWKPEARYDAVGQVNQVQCRDFIDAAKRIIAAI